MKVPAIPLLTIQRALLITAMLAIAFLVCACDSHYTPQEGDVAFQSLPHNPLIDTIEGSTGSPYSHCGIVHQAGAEWKVIEAIGPVKETSLTAWEMQGRDYIKAVELLEEALGEKLSGLIIGQNGKLKAATAVKVAA